MMPIIACFFDFIGNNKIVSIVVGAAIVGAGGWFVKWIQNKRDSNRIYRHLSKSAANTGWDFRSTEAISSTTQIPTNRVAELCSRDKRIKRNEKEKESWRFA